VKSGKVKSGKLEFQVPYKRYWLSTQNRKDGIRETRIRESEKQESEKPETITRIRETRSRIRENKKWNPGKTKSGKLRQAYLRDSLLGGHAPDVFWSKLTVSSLHLCSSCSCWN
jgi:hypothetical protein